jgi:hypothetical protein
MDFLEERHIDEMMSADPDTREEYDLWIFDFTGQMPAEKDQDDD